MPDAFIFLPDHSDQGLRLAKQYVWWMLPDEAAEKPKKIILQLLKMGTLEDYRTGLEIWGREAFVAALETMNPGDVDENSWNYWRLHYGLPPKPFPKREIP
ncbi:MAG: hypothetical protein M0T84_06170 [Betaproteobacteria bacterium]|nr:hypothetical protein [Betaproteobacteria bacterium]